MNYYECHITLDGDKDRLDPLVRAIGWKFSAIDGDPVLGRGIKCYATKHYNARNSPHDIVNALLTAAQLLTNCGAVVTRRKVELVIYDDRSSKVRCTGGCIECHLDDFQQSKEIT